MSKSKFVNLVKGALWDCEKSAGLGAKFLWKISKSHSSYRDYGQGQETGGFVCAMLNKIPGIRADFVWLDDNTQEQEFPELLESLRKWCDRNPTLTDGKPKVAQKGHTCKLKMPLQTKNFTCKLKRLLQIKNKTCKLKIVHAN